MAEAAIISALNALGCALASEALKLASSQDSKLHSTFSVLNSGIKDISNELLLMQAFLNGINTHDCNNEAFRAWLVQVRNIAYNIQDTVDEFIYLVGNKKFGGIWFFMKKLFKDPKSFDALKGIVSQLQKAETRLKNLVMMKDKWVSLTNAVPGGNPYYFNESSQNAAVSAHFIDEDKLVGVEKNRARITSWLFSEGPNLSVIYVWGMGGLGKTTLVTNVFKREKNKFDCHSWVSISQTYTVDHLLRNLVTGICESEKRVPIDTTSMDLRKFKETRRILLKEKRYLIILDDAWDLMAFESIRDALVDGYKGRRIIITSRSEDVASLAPQKQKLQLKPLTYSESWELFCIKAFHIETYHEKCLNENWIVLWTTSAKWPSSPVFILFTILALSLFCMETFKSETCHEHTPNQNWSTFLMTVISVIAIMGTSINLYSRVLTPSRPPFRSSPGHECPPDLEKLANEIVLKCEGLPLALVSIGGMLSLREKSAVEWKCVHDQLSWELEYNPSFGHLRNILNLSFNYLPRNLKNCFLYCCLFPEDHLLARRKLIRLWIAEGFIEERGASTLV